MQSKTISYKNHFCDMLACALGEYFDFFQEDEKRDLNLEKLSIEELKLLCEYAIVKNKLAGVRELNLKVPRILNAGELFEKYHIDGKEILSARQMSDLTTNQLVGGRIMLLIEDLLDYKEGLLNEISDFLGRVDIPVVVCLGKTLEEVGKLVNRYGKSPAEILEDFGFLDRECFLYGLNFLDKEDQKLLLNYNVHLIFSPITDAEEGRGAINLYNFIYNRLTFGFSSGKCYNIDMCGEAKLAQFNTNNLMYQRGLVSLDDLNKALGIEEIEPFDKQTLESEFIRLKKHAKEIAERIKE